MLHDLIQLRLYIAKCKANNKLLLACNNSSIVNIMVSRPYAGVMHELRRIFPFSV